MAFASGTSRMIVSESQHETIIEMTIFPEEWYLKAIPFDWPQDVYGGGWIQDWNGEYLCANVEALPQTSHAWNRVYYS